MTPRGIDQRVHNYELRSKSYELLGPKNGEDNGLYVINTLFNTVTSVRNPKISFCFRDIMKMAKNEITMVREGVRKTMQGFMDSGDLTNPPAEDVPLVIPSWAIRNNKDFE